MTYSLVVLFAGIVQTIGLNCLLQLKVIGKTSSVVAALIFVTTAAVVIAGFMLPGMYYVISMNSTVSSTTSLLFASSIPLLWVLKFLSSSSHLDFVDVKVSQLWLHFPRISIVIFWIVCLVFFLPLSDYICKKYPNHIPQIASRKLFHFLSVAMFTPIIMCDSEMMFLSFSVAFCALLLLEYIR